jgi:outer membrane receptor for ferrienterochelin and colicins
LLVRLLGLMAFLLTGLITLAQQAAILVIDAKTNESIPYAHICLEGIKSKKQVHYLTDLKGKAPNELKERSKLAVSYIGYETITDTLDPGTNLTLKLNPAVFSTSEMVVTAQFKPERVDRSIYKVNLINSRLIEQKAASNLTDLLAGESNMRISQGGVLGTSLSVQGLTGENVKFLVDGIPVIGRMNGNIDLNQMNLYNVDHVEVIEGPMSVVYGSNAIAGVINVITKENKLASFSTYSNAYYESIGVYNFDAGVSQRVKHHLFSVDAARNFFSGNSDDGSQRDMRWKPRRQYNADAYYLFSSDKSRIKLSGQYFNELLLDKGPLLLPYYETAFDNYFSTIRATGKLESSFTPRKDRQWSIVAAYSDYNRIKNRYFNDLTTLEKVLTPNSDDQDTTTFNNSLLRAWYNHSDKYAAVNFQAGIDLNLEGGSGKRILDEKQKIGDYAAFFSLKYDPLKSVSIQPGVRAIYNTKYNAPLVYSLNVKWSPGTRWALRGTYARGFRSPALKELYLYFVDINHNVRGNPDLEAESSHNFNLNLSYNKESSKTYFSADAGIFYNNVDNNITLAPVGYDLYTYINIGNYVSRGGQLNTSFNFYPKLSFRIGFSTTSQSYAFDKGAMKNAASYWNTDITGTINYRIEKRNLTFSAFYKYSGKAPQIFPYDDRTISVGWVNDYHTMDLSVMKAFLRNHLFITLGGKNLFDVRIIPSTGNAGGAHSGNSDSINVAWGRTYFVKLSFNFNKYK